MDRFKNILYVHDGSSDAAKETFEMAIEIARRNSGRLDAVSVVEAIPTFVASATLMLIRTRSLDVSRKALASFVGSARPDIVRSAKVIEGRPHIEIIREVLRRQYDLVIKPIGPDGFVDRLIGRLDMRLLRHCPCAVWLSNGGSFENLDTVLAAVDGGDPENQEVEDALNRQIMELAMTLCASSQAQLHVAHAWRPPFLTVYSNKRAGFARKEINAAVAGEKKYHKNWLDRLMRRSRKWADREVCKSVRRRTHLREGHAGEEIPALADEIKADVIVMGTVGRTGVSGLIMGNTAEQILDQLSCSVLAVKPPGFVTQVELEN